MASLNPSRLEVTTRITVGRDDTISTAVPLPAGEYIASITLHG